jgi:site-specific DNA recombinase
MKTLRCAIYTRKSSEEGLDQEFNSLDAQRESCEAYIKSQAHEGWKLIRKRYDDGGFSGGNLERPGLKQLLKDIHENLVDTVVVYKVDRLTRSLMDFSKIVEVFDNAGASFVAVTQHFNTTNSMGRLTLNVLLSFAQFEREVTGERIRDKIAASKKKGMWTGGVPPMGYEVKDKKLVVIESEAKQVRNIYNQYLPLDSVGALFEKLKEQDIRSRVWISTKGIEHGGLILSRGALYHLLQNKTYLGQIEYKGKTFEGEHKAIIPDVLWDTVQEKLKAHQQRKGIPNRNKQEELLEGLIYDDVGNIMTPTYSMKTSNKRYRYYVSAPLIRNIKKPVGDVGRVPAMAMEKIISDRISTLMNISESKIVSRDLVLNAIKRITVYKDHMEVLINRDVPNLNLARLKSEHDEVIEVDGMKLIRIHATIMKKGGEKIIVGPDGKAITSFGTPDPNLVRNIAQAHAWRKGLETGKYKSLQAIAESIECVEGYVRKLIPLAYLAPDIVESILYGTQPAALELQHLVKGNLPLDWNVQRIQLGFTVRS